VSASKASTIFLQTTVVFGSSLDGQARPVASAGQPAA
jgi:hypothetical protein